MMYGFRGFYTGRAGKEKAGNEKRSRFMIPAPSGERAYKNETVWDGGTALLFDNTDPSLSGRICIIAAYISV